MRAYITVIVDSFQEALASRVLYILLLGLTLVLLALIPLGYSEQRSLKIRGRDIDEWPAFVTELNRQAELTAASPGKRIVELAGKSFAKTTADVSSKGELTFAKVNELVEGLNAVLEMPSLYDEAAWHTVHLQDEARDLLARGTEKLSHDDLVYLNRLLLRDAFPANLGSIDDKELFVTYAWWTIPEPVPGGKVWFPRIVRATLSTFTDFFVGTVAVFVAILVTAPIIPRTFEPGAIDLLLSKPISRSLLIGAKFLGGCAFIFLTAGYFIVGLWLIVGWRLDVWSIKLLLCIPIFMFRFAIYYAVSLLSGVIWRNAIVCIVVTAVFFLSCFGIGTLKFAIERTFITPNQLIRIVPTDDGFVCMTEAGQFVQWNEAGRTWDEVLQDSNRRMRRPMGPAMPASVLGPVYHGKSRSLVYLRKSPQGRPFRFLTSGSELLIARWEGNWKAEAGPTPPAGSSSLVQDRQGRIVLVGATGIFAFEPSSVRDRPALKILGFELPSMGKKNSYTRIGPPENSDLSNPHAAAIDPQSGNVLVDSERSLMLLAKNSESEFTILDSVSHESAGLTMVGLTKSVAVVVASDGLVQLRALPTLKLEDSFRPAGNSPPRAVATSEDGCFVVVVFQNGILWAYDLESHQGEFIESDSTAAAFDGEKLLYADSRRRVHILDVGTDKTTKVYRPQIDTLSWCFYWLIRPLYVAFPKPGELGDLVDSLLTEEADAMPQGRPAEMNGDRIRQDATISAIHGALFVLVMIAIACVHVERADL